VPHDGGSYRPLDLTLARGSTSASQRQDQVEERILAFSQTGPGMVQLGLDAVLTGNPAAVAKTKVRTARVNCASVKRTAWPNVCLLGYALKPKGAAQIVCTLGPKSRSVPVLEELLRAGMSVARFNFSHGSHEYHQVRDTWARAPGRNVPALGWCMLLGPTSRACRPAPVLFLLAAAVSGGATAAGQAHRLPRGGTSTCACLPQETLDTLRKAMRNTCIMCAVMLDTKVRRGLGAIEHMAGSAEDAG